MFDEPKLTEMPELSIMVIGGRMVGRRSQAILSAKARILLTSSLLTSAHIAAVAAMASIQVKDNSNFIQQKMQNKRRIY